MNLKDKKVLITGSTGGIGYSIVNKFSSLGAKVAASGTNEEKLNHLKKNFPEIEIIRDKCPIASLVRVEHGEKVGISNLGLPS